MQMRFKTVAWNDLNCNNNNKALKHEYHYDDMFVTGCPASFHFERSSKKTNDENTVDMTLTYHAAYVPRVAICPKRFES